MNSEILTYQADGLTMVSHLFFEGDIAQVRPAVLVFPEAFGLGEHAKSRAERLAALGYVALACDLHADGKIIPMEDLMPVLDPLRQDPSRIRARAGGGLKALLGRREVDASRIAAIGYCFGGTMALELARGGAGLAGVVGFHSGLATSAFTAALRRTLRKTAGISRARCCCAWARTIPASRRSNGWRSSSRCATVAWTGK
jgi:dienelactone hydrolase